MAALQGVAGGRSQPDVRDDSRVDRARPLTGTRTVFDLPKTLMKPLSRVGSLLAEHDIYVFDDYAPFGDSDLDRRLAATVRRDPVHAHLRRPHPRSAGRRAGSIDVLDSARRRDHVRREPAHDDSRLRSVRRPTARVRNGRDRSRRRLRTRPSTSIIEPYPAGR